MKMILSGGILMFFTYSRYRFWYRFVACIEKSEYDTPANIVKALVRKQVYKTRNTVART